MEEQRYIRISRRLVERLSTSASTDQDGRKRKLKAAILDRLAARMKQLKEIHEHEPGDGGASLRL